MANSSPNEQLKPGIYRQRFSYESNFTQVKNSWIRDPNLSMKAKGLLVYLLTHEIGYIITLQQIIRETSDGKSAIRATIAELVEVGYLETVRTSKENGWNAGLAYFLQEPAKTPMSENPTLENPTLDNRTAYRENNLIKEENLKENNLVQTESELVSFNAFWNLYPRKQGKIEAEKAFHKALQTVTADELMAAVFRFAHDPNLPTNKRFIVLPATWLNQGRWMDEPLPGNNWTPTENDNNEEGYF
jgi:hypothetical protein